MFHWSVPISSLITWSPLQRAMQLITNYKLSIVLRLNYAGCKEKKVRSPISFK